MPTDDDHPPSWKKRVMKRGDWVDPDAEPAPVRADKTVSVRLTEAELAESQAKLVPVRDSLAAD